MYHIWKISKIISSETRENKQAEMKPKVAKRITTSQPHPTTLPPPPTPTPFHDLSANKLSRPKLVRKRPQLVQSWVVFEQTTIFNGLLNTGTKLLYTAEDTCLLRLW